MMASNKLGLNRFLYQDIHLKSKVVMLLIGIGSITIFLMSVCDLLEFCSYDSDISFSERDYNVVVKENVPEFHGYELEDTVDKV